MADTSAVRLMESIFARTDRQTRDIIAAQQSLAAEVDTINVLIGDGASVLVPGVAAALRVDFRARITGSFVQEFDGTSGSVVLDIAKAQPGPAPSFASIVASTPPTIASGRYGADDILAGWIVDIDRGDLLRFSVASASAIMRILVALRIRRLEP